MQIQGTLFKIFDTQVIGEKKFRKREMILKDNSEKYPQYVTFQFVNDNCAYLDSFNPGENVTVTFNVRGREWKSPDGGVKYFNTLEAWKLERNGSQPTSKPSERVVNDDLPF